MALQGEGSFSFMPTSFGDGESLFSRRETLVGVLAASTQP
jgi:hypothetical protein